MISLYPIHNTQKPFSYLGSEFLSKAYQSYVSERRLAKQNAAGNDQSITKQRTIGAHRNHIS